MDVLSLSLIGPLCVVCVLDSLEEEAETLLKDSDTQDSSIGGHCSTLSADTCAMFRPRHDHDKGAEGGRNKDVSIPLVGDRNSDEAAAIKVRTGSWSPQQPVRFCFSRGMGEA